MFMNWETSYPHLAGEQQGPSLSSALPGSSVQSLIGCGDEGRQEQEQAVKVGLRLPDGLSEGNGEL